MYWCPTGTALTNGRWQSLTMLPHLISQEDSSEMHFLMTEHSTCIFSCNLTSAGKEIMAQRDSLVQDYASGWWRKWDLTQINETLNLSKPVYCLCLSTPSCQMTFPSRLLRVAPAGILQALGRIQLETTYLSSSCLPQHILSSFAEFSLAASPMLPRITAHRHSGIQACILGSALKGSQPKTSSESLDTCLSIIWLSCCDTHRVK